MEVEFTNSEVGVENLKEQPYQRVKIIFLMNSCPLRYNFFHWRPTFNKDSAAIFPKLHEPTLNTEVVLKVIAFITYKVLSCIVSETLLNAFKIGPFYRVNLQSTNQNHPVDLKHNEFLSVLKSQDSLVICESGINDIALVFSQNEAFFFDTLCGSNQDYTEDHNYCIMHVDFTQHKSDIRRIFKYLKQKGESRSVKPSKIIAQQDTSAGSTHLADIKRCINTIDLVNDKLTSELLFNVDVQFDKISTAFMSASIKDLPKQVLKLKENKILFKSQFDCNQEHIKSLKCLVEKKTSLITELNDDKMNYIRRITHMHTQFIQKKRSPIVVLKQPKVENLKSIPKLLKNSVDIVKPCRKKPKLIGNKESPSNEISILDKSKGNSSTELFSCVVCLDSVRHIMLSECNHLVYCNSCFQDNLLKVKQSSKKNKEYKCPTCNRISKSYIDVKIT